MSFEYFYFSQRAPLYWQIVCTAKKYCTKITSTAASQKYECNENDTLTNRVTHAIKNATKANKTPTTVSNVVYEPRINYAGFLRNCTWHYKQPDSKSTEATESANINNEASHKETEDNRKSMYWKKFSLLMGFSGTNYMGMQFNPNVPTIEDAMFRAMVNNNWITEANMKKPWTVSFQRGSRTDRGVSAARQCCSIMLR